MRRYLFVGVIFVATVAVGVPSVQADTTESSPLPQYSLQVLQLPAKYTQGGAAAALNDNGEVVGLGAYYTGDPVYTAYDAVLWRNGVASDISSQVHGGSPTAIGDNDVVVGNCSDDQTACSTFAANLTTGTYETMGLDSALGINPQGTVAVGTVDSGNQAGEWQNGVTTTLPDADSNSGAWAMNTQGDIVGERRSPSMTASVPEEWTSSGDQALPGICNFGGSLAIDDQGDIAGEGQGTSCPEYTYSFLNHDGQTIDLGVLPGYLTSWPVGIADGMVVGNEEQYDSTTAPYVYAGTQMVPLQNLVTNGAGWQVTQATAVNRAGQILAWAVNANGVGSSVLLTPEGSFSPPPLPTLSSISLSPVPSHVDSGSDLELQATAHWSDGTTSPLTTQAAWSVTNLQKVSGGEFEARSPGPATVTVTDGSVSDSVNVNVVGPTSIALSPTNPSVALNSEPQFTATGTFADGTTADITSVSDWTSSDPAIATVTNVPGSILTYDDPGGTTISASDGDASASTTLTVTSGATTTTTTSSTTTTRTPPTTTTTTRPTTTTTSTPPTTTTTTTSPITTTSNPVTSPTVTTSQGYDLVGSDGGIFTFGSAPFYGSTGSLKLQRPVVGITPTADHGGYWLAASDGGVFAFGDAGFYGSIPGLGFAPANSSSPKRLNAPIVGMVPSAHGGGYFMVASDGGVFTFGDATFAGSCPGIGGCSGAAVSVMPDATGKGYWVVTQTGDIYAFGDAPYLGAPGPGAAPVTSAARTPDGRGYWILFADGVVDAFGDAANLGGPSGSVGVNNPATAVFATSDGGGYWVATADGSVFSFGDATYDGGTSTMHLNGAIIAATGW